MMTFGQHLKALRTQMGMSQDALAGQLFVTRQSVSQWENDRTMPSVDLLLKLSEIFEISVDALLGREEAETEPQPVVTAQILRSPRDIRAAMRCEFATVTIIMLSLAVMLGVIALLRFYLETHVLSPAVTALLKNDFRVVRQVSLAAVLCLLTGLAARIVAVVRARRAVAFGREHDCTLQFFAERLVIEESAAEPLCLFYTNIRRITETDGYFIFTMQNRVRMCVDKAGLDDPEILSQLLRSGKRYLDRRLCRDSSETSRAGRSVVRFSRDFLFVAGFFTFELDAIVYAVLSTIVTENRPLRWLLFSIPFLLLAAELIVGAFFVLRHFKAKRMLIGGGVMAVILIVTAILTNTGILYDLQHDRMTAEDFQRYMTDHGMEVENTIKGRQENFISSCYTATLPNSGYEFFFMEFDVYSGGYGLFSAYEAYGDLINEIRSEPRLSTSYAKQDLSFNQFYTETTNNHYAYASLNEYSVFYVNTSPDHIAEVQEILRDLELAHPY